MYDLLRGLRIIDLSTVVLGPYATQLLADMGADVIKVEPKRGDVFRTARPGRDGGDGAGFLNLNRNKKSIALDLTDSNDHALLMNLVSTADVFVHNLRDRSAAKNRIDYETISRRRPRIVYCHARGFGRGVSAGEPAYDDCIQASAGLAWLNADDGGMPRFVRSLLCDKVAGLHLAFAIAAGVLARERNGKGVQIELPMYEAMASFLLVEQLSGQTFVPPLPDRGYVRLNADGRRPHKTKDGFIAIMPYTAAQWQRFFKAIGQDDLVHSSLITDDEDRSQNIDQLYQIIAKVAPSKTTEDWLLLLRAADVPVAPVNRLDDLPNDDHLRSVNFFKRISHPAEGALLSASSPFVVVGDVDKPDRPAPVLDGDRAAIVAELNRRA